MRRLGFGILYSNVLFALSVGIFACSSTADFGETSESRSAFADNAAIRPTARQQLCLDVDYGRNENGTSPILWTCHGGTSQTWTIRPDGSIRVFGDKCLDVANGDSRSGARVQIYQCNAGNPNQKWLIDGQLLRFSNSNSCLDVSGGNFQDGAALQMWDCGVSNPNQQWTLGDRPEPPGTSPTTPNTPPRPEPGSPPTSGFQLFFGQDTDTLTDLKYNSKLPDPHGVTLYTNLTNITSSSDSQANTLGGIPKSGNVFSDALMPSPVDYGSGKIDFKATTGLFPQAALAVGLYLSDPAGGCRNQPLRAIIGRSKADAITGTSNTDISPQLEQQYAYYAKQLGAYFKSLGSRKVLLRIGYEFDGMWNCYNPIFYKEAFRVLTRTMRTEAPNVMTVWQSAVWSRPDDAGANASLYDFRSNGSGGRLAESDSAFGQRHLESWYPGDDVVDLVGFSYFYGTTWTEQWGADGGGAAYSPPSAQEAIMRFAKQHKKKVFIAESAPQGFDIGNSTLGTIFNGPRIRVSADDIWRLWFVPYVAFLRQHASDLAGAAYINTNWQSQPQWSCAVGARVGGPGCSQGYWGDTRLHASALIRDRFAQEMSKMR
jgi:hypothetical protein